MRIAPAFRQVLRRLFCWHLWSSVHYDVEGAIYCRQTCTKCSHVTGYAVPRRRVRS